MRRFGRGLLLVWGAVLFGGCGDEIAREGDPLPAEDGTATFSVPRTPEQLHEAIKKANWSYNGLGQFELGSDGQIAVVSLRETRIRNLKPLKGLSLQRLDLLNAPVDDLSPLKGMELELLGLEGTRVADLTPLAGMPLVELWLNNAPVSDISPLRGMPLGKLSLLGTSVKDLSPLEGMPLGTLWLNKTPVEDISALRRASLESLTLEGTRVSDISILSEMASLQRLHIAETPITDLTPLRGLALTRLIWTPARITKGIEAVREMGTISEIGTSLESRLGPSRFWELYDKGQFR